MRSWQCQIKNTETALVMFQKTPKFLGIDDFLPVPLVASLLEYALASESLFEPTGLMRNGLSQFDSDVRISDRCSEGLGLHKAAFKALIHARLGEFFVALGISAFDVAKTEFQLIAHGNGAFYKSHYDSVSGEGHEFEDNVRVVTAVYYFNHAPKRFTGGAIALFPFGSGEDAEHATAIEPLHNRLVVFPSFVRHEVREVSCPSGDFADSRFAINCWLRKDKGEAKASPPRKLS